ncbi:cation-transporting P-type ATPase [Corallococcus sp. AB011P]|uniref:cation-transporting P-type ATPase n=1 Tax=Corallococcus sp. AB011P TaxID=2316735 RepID=UPI0013152E29|nr:cation-transporting P-type ATPase [Corallococcus sp. AB011P]
MKIHHLTVAESLRSLDSRADGLASAEAERRQHEFGVSLVLAMARRNVVVRDLVSVATLGSATVIARLKGLGFQRYVSRSSSNRSVIFVASGLHRVLREDDRQARGTRHLEPWGHDRQRPG